MGKTKQAKEKKFDRNVEISAPILDPEIIKAIHSPPRGQRLDLKHGGFKALLSDLNSQDSTDEMSPLNENHVPSYIGISCAVSGYSNYSSYTKRSSASPMLGNSNNNNNNSNTNNATSHQLSSPQNRSRTTSPSAHRHHHHHSDHVHHITIDKNNIQSPDEERKELTEKLIASAAEHRRSPSPITPTEDDRHHGTYVGARYCPLPPPSKIVNKHIPLLGIDDDQNPDEHPDEVNKVEQKIANLYGDEFVEDWRESMTHKAKKEMEAEQQQVAVKNPKDLVTLKPTPPPVKRPEEDKSQQMVADLPTPSAKVLAGVEKQFLNKLLTDENPPTPSPPPYLISPVKETKEPKTGGQEVESPTPPTNQSPVHTKSKTPEQASPTPPPSPEPIQVSEPVQRDATTTESSPPTSPPAGAEEHIEYEIRTESPVDNEASPVRMRSEQLESPQQPTVSETIVEENLVSFTPEPSLTLAAEDTIEKKKEELVENEGDELLAATNESEINMDGRYYLNLLDQEKSFIMSQVAEAESILAGQESELDEDTTGRIRSAIGKANLLVNKKCNQFKELCESNMNAKADEQYATLNDDLAGFWDMIRIQMEDVRKSFENIWIAKASNWQTNTTGPAAADSADDDSRESSLKDTNSRATNKPKLSAQKDQKRRERLQEHINQMKQNQATKSDQHMEGSLIETAADDLEQVGCDTIETVVAADVTESNLLLLNEGSDTVVVNQDQQQQPAAATTTTTTEEAEEQLFSLMA